MNMKRTNGIARTAIMVACMLVFTAGIMAQNAPNATYQFFNSTEYKYLKDPAPVYRTVSYDQLIKLFESDGTYMILFGGSWCGNTQAVVGLINDVAKEYGVETIYNFDWRVDGAKVHLRDTKNPYANLYVDVVNKYLPNIVTIYDKASNNVSYTAADGTTVAANKLQVPFLFIYNKNNIVNGQSAPILASFEKMMTWEKDFQTNGQDDPAKMEAYKKEIRPLFEYISKKTGLFGLGKKVAQLDTFTDFEYYSTAINAKAGTTILDAADEPWLMQTVSYIELTRILDSQGTYVFMFGGPWCGNTRAVIKYVNEYARKYGVTKVYTFDTKLDSNILQIRDSKNPYGYMYVDLVNKYFPGIVTEFGDNRARDISYTNADGQVVAAPRLQVPYVFIYNKDHKDAAGQPDPILGQIELMYTWENIQPGFKDEAGNVGANYKTYTAALDALFSQLKK